MVEKEKPPKLISHPREWAAYHFEKNRANLKAAWLSVSIIAISALWLGYQIKGILDEGALKGKDSTIQGLQTRSDNYEQVQRENRELRISLAEFTAPLKKRAVILANQLNEFVQQASTNKSEIDFMNSYSEYNNRFMMRVEKIVNQLDEVGQHSDTLSTVLRNPLDLNIQAFTNIITISKELQKLATNLKE